MPHPMWELRNHKAITAPAVKVEEGTNKPLTSECAKGENESAVREASLRGGPGETRLVEVGGEWPHVGANRTVVARTQASGLRDKTLGFMLGVEATLRM